MNLLEETILAIREIDHEIEDIVFIGSQSSDHSCTWSEFEVLANHNYDSGYGTQEVACDLIIVFADGSEMWRYEYDGSEWWAYSRPFKMPTETKPIKTLFGGYSSLAEINR